MTATTTITHRITRQPGAPDAAASAADQPSQRHPPADSRRRRPRRRALRRLAWALLLLLLLLGGWALWSWRLAERAREHLGAAQAALAQRPLTSAAAHSACAEVAAASADLDMLRRLVNPAAPLLRRLGFLPRVGELATSAPALVELGSAAGALGEQLCSAGQPAFAALDAPAEQRLALGLRTLLEGSTDLAPLRMAAERLAGAWQALPERALEQRPLAAYAEQLRRVGPQLLELPAALATAERLRPALPALLGLDGPHSLLILGQNPMELRATGGFIGSLGTLTVEQGRASAISYVNSGALNVEAPPGTPLPAPYASYLRASRWYLRDANWWADFPTSARTTQSFWQLNGGQAVQGVVAVDIYALQEIVRALGGVDVPGYGAISGQGTLETVFGIYELKGSQTSTDKAFLGALLRAVAARVQGLPAAQLPALLAALGRSLDERHISIFLHDQAAAQALSAQGWDGALRAPPGDYLQIVDADLSYSDVQAYIDERSSYAVELDPQLRPLTSTLTLTITNRYDPWLAERTSARTYGYCYNTATRLQERVPGCYGDYVRFYLPAGVAVRALEGADGPLEPAVEGGRSVAGAYVLVYPGETRVLRLRYRHYAGDEQPGYQLTLQKQAGTLARPVQIELSSGAARLSLTTDLWRDRQVEVALQDGQLTLQGELGPRHPQNSDAALASLAAYERGRARWLAGDQAGAARIWRESDTAERALDMARALMLRGDQRQALALVEQLREEQANAARLAYLEGELLERQGQPEQAVLAYRRSLERDPGNQAPRWALVQLYQRAGDQQAALELLRQLADPLSRLRLLAREQPVAEAAVSLRLLLQLAPDDASAYDGLYGLYRYQSPAPLDWPTIQSICDDAIARFPQQALWLQRRAETWEWLGQPALAIPDLQQASVLSPTNPAILSGLGRLRWSAGADAEGALQSYAMLRGVDPGQPDGYLGAAQVLVAQGRNEEALQLLRAGDQATGHDARIMDALEALERGTG